MDYSWCFVLIYLEICGSSNGLLVPKLVLFSDVVVVNALMSVSFGGIHLVFSSFY